MKRQTFSEKFDWTLCLILFLFLLISVFSIYSAQTTGQYRTNFVFLQIRWYIFGIILLAIVMYFDPDQIKKLSWYLYGFGIFLLIMLVVIRFALPGTIVPERNGAYSWFVLPMLGAIQPSEFMKTFLILALSRMAVIHNEKTIHKTLKTDFMLLLKLGALTGIPLFLIMLQPDLGTSLVIMAIFLGIVFVSGISWKLLFPILGSVAAIGSFLIYLVLYFPDLLERYLGVQKYQFNRIYAWLKPEEASGDISYHIEKSLSAIGSGMLSGKGFQERVVYIPESHSDSIFSVIGEEWGFIGGSVVIGLYFILIFHITKIALSTKNPFISYASAGVISMITFHVFQNIGMAIRVLPITGIPLPFISYGGSSLMGNMLAMGLIFSFQYYNKGYMFSNREYTVSSSSSKGIKESL
ncbi:MULTISPECIES: FtsW/RodA/SpoVE family cell cycle protein [Bacillus]|uniref:FtsW/RodA/SpoVE family cell cycle protein n=1 Tax=Bacillus TaxID=1386 RepID=UPI0002D70F66|nr:MULTISPECIES: FtsW/RodA/SpoVE family cell cycle protein [Bacillus]